MIGLSKLCSPPSDQISLLLQDGLRDAHEVTRDVDMNTKHQTDLSQDQLGEKLVYIFTVRS